MPRYLPMVSHKSFFVIFFQYTYIRRHTLLQANNRLNNQEEKIEDDRPTHRWPTAGPTNRRHCWLAKKTKTRWFYLENWHLEMTLHQYLMGVLPFKCSAVFKLLSDSLTSVTNLLTNSLIMCIYFGFRDSWSWEELRRKMPGINRSDIRTVFFTL